MEKQKNLPETGQSKCYNTPLVIGWDLHTAEIIKIYTTSFNDTLECILKDYGGSLEKFVESLIKKNLCLVFSEKREEKRKKKRTRKKKS